MKSPKFFPFQCPVLLILSQEVSLQRNLALSISLDIPVPKDYPLATRSVLHFPQPAPRALAGPPHLKILCDLLAGAGESVLCLPPAVWWNKIGCEGKGGYTHSPCNFSFLKCE